MMTTVELKPLIGQRVDQATGKLQNVLWHDIERLYLNGRQIATINKIPGAAIGLLPGAILTMAEKEAVSVAVAEARGGVRPSKIGEPVSWEIVDDDEIDLGDTDLEDSDE